MQFGPFLRFILGFVQMPDGPEAMGVTIAVFGQEHPSLAQMFFDALQAQRFRFGDHIRFVALEDEPIFNRYIGTVRETPNGLKLNQVHVKPGDSRPRTITVSVDPQKAVRIGHAFRTDGVAQVIANLSNKSRTQRHEVKIKLLDDFSVEMRAHDDILLAEWVPGGNDIIVDNFNDTGEIDTEPKDFMARIVSRNANSWLCAELPDDEV